MLGKRKQQVAENTPAVEYGELEIDRGGRIAGTIERLPEEPLRAVTTPPPAAEAPEPVKLSA